MKQQYNKIYRSAVKAEMALKHINLPRTQPCNHILVTTEKYNQLCTYFSVIYT